MKMAVTCRYQDVSIFPSPLGVLHQRRSPTRVLQVKSTCDGDNRALKRYQNDNKRQQNKILIIYKPPKTINPHAKQKRTTPQTLSSDNKKQQTTTKFVAAKQGYRNSKPLGSIYYYEMTRKRFAIKTYQNKQKLTTDMEKLKMMLDARYWMLDAG